MKEFKTKDSMCELTIHDDGDIEIETPLFQVQDRTIGYMDTVSIRITKARFREIISFYSKHAK